MKTPWMPISVLAGAVGMIAVTAPYDPAPLLSGGAVRPFEGLEIQASLSPRDAAVSLARAYLDAGQPGLAVATLVRAERAGADKAEVAHLEARAWLQEGHASRAYRYAQDALMACSHTSCRATLLAQATRQSDLCEALLDVGIEDPASDPARALEAIRRSSREVRLAVR